MKTIPCKTIVTRTKNSSWFGADYNMNIYRGCCHGCIYCDSRSDCYGNADFDTVKVKENALGIIEHDLSRLRKKGVVATGSMSDPYNPEEKALNLTGGALKLLSRHGFGLAVATKSPLVTKDIAALKQIAEKSPVIVKMTITTADDVLCKKIERHLPSSSERFKAIELLAKNGIYCGVLLMPLLPFINDMAKNVSDIVRSAGDSGAKFIYQSFGVTLRDRQREFFYDCLDESFPGLKEKYIKRFGNSYACNSPDAAGLYGVFTAECEKYGIKYKMPEIIQDYKGKDNEQTQLSMF